MKKLYLSLFNLLLVFCSTSVFAQNLTLNATATSPTCNNGTNGSISVDVSGCPGPYTITSNPALTFNNGVANNVAPGTYTINATSPASGGTQTLYSTNFATAEGWQLNIPTGSEGGTPNPWVSGNIGGSVGGPGAGPCGSASSSGLFIRCSGFVCDLFGGGGPVYNASSAANNTDRAAHLTQDINTTGLNNITLRFNWRCGGSPQAFATVRYSINGGTTWIDLPQQYHFNTSWQCATVNLPVETANINNLRIGFRWRNGNNNGDQDPPIVITNVAVEGTGSGGAGCSGSTTVVVQNPPASNFTLQASGPLSLCAGQSVTLSAPAGFTGVTWSNGATGNAITVTEAGSYNATGNDANGCVSSSNTLNVVVDNNVGVMEVIASGSLNICQGQSVTLTAEAGISNLLWSTGENEQSITVNQAGTYSATGNNSLGCPVASAEFEVTVGQAQPGEISVSPVSPATFCPGGSVTLTAADGFFNYEWSNQQEGQSITVSQEGAYIVNAINAEGCEASSLPVIVQQIDIPQPSFTYTQTDGYTIVFTNTSNFGSTYQWTFTVGNTSSQENPSFTFPFDGTYPVTLTVTNECGSNSVTINVIVEKLSVKNVDANLLSVNVQPNPTNGLTNIKGETMEPANYQFALYNAIGQRVMSENWKVHGSWSRTIDLTSLPKGMYWVNLESKNGSISRKLIKL
ncbi:MAG: T9SS type A sorting domain-containing protein [Flavobacteriales bacterium]